MRMSGAVVSVVLGALAVVGLNGVPTPASAAVTCNGLAASIVGTESDDFVEGTPGRDVIVALGGNDRIFGHGGGDVVVGADGNDRAFGGSGNDVMFGESGNDHIDAGSGKDYLSGGSGGAFSKAARDVTASMGAPARTSSPRAA